ncbi:Ig-like domain-containing protein [Pelotomaculum propionicicum]|uniref:Ig-like domain-containing protein n=1 Tax=Pelotomaculum propionicicum TaxID=258475 RepID=UPI003B7AB00C
MVYTVVVSASDNSSGQLQAQVKVDNGTFGEWVNIPDNYLFVPLSDGAHTITVKVQDAAGNITTQTMTAFGL